MVNRKELNLVNENSVAFLQFVGTDSMIVKIHLAIDHGSFENGFEVSLRVADKEKVKGTLPPCPTLPELYKNWQTDYQGQLVPIVE